MFLNKAEITCHTPPHSYTPSMQCKGLPDLLPLPGSRVTHTAGVYVCAFAYAKYWHWPRIKLSDTVLPPHPWTTVKNKREERCGRPPLQGKREKETWERHRWRQSEICHEFECWDCGNAINVWRRYKSFWFETHMHYYAWLLMYWLSNSNGKQVLHTLRPPTHTSGGIN